MTEASGEVFGYSEITRQYYNRYRLPVMHTETNLKEGPTGQEAVQWLWKEWANVLRIPQHRHPDRRLHLVFADRPDRLGFRRSASRTATSIRSASMISIATSATSAVPTSN